MIMIWFASSGFGARLLSVKGQPTLDKGGRRRRMKSKLCCFLLAVFLAPFVRAQESPFFAEDAGNRYWIRPDVVYGVENGHENKLDVIYPHNATAAVPTVIYIHGGGWVFGDKGAAVLEVLPYLKMGWAAVNVEYRMASASKAPGRGRRLPLCPALGGAQCQGLSHRSHAARGDRAFRWRPSLADDGNVEGKRWPRQQLSRGQK